MTEQKTGSPTAPTPETPEPAVPVAPAPAPDAAPAPEPPAVPVPDVVPAAPAPGEPPATEALTVSTQPEVSASPATAAAPVADVVPAAPAPEVPASGEPAATEVLPVPAPPAVPAAASAAAPPASMPPAPPAPPFPVADPPGGAQGAPGTSKPPRRVLRAIARWTVAVLVMGGLGAGTLAGITASSRTDVPGLATQDDGRWDYPELSLPALPADAPRPFNDANVAEVHHADLRQLLLPAPAGATVDKKLDGGWVSTPQYVSEYAKGERADISRTLRDSALRHIAARGWTMPDGTSSRIYLLQFNSTAFATAFQDDLLEKESGPALTEVAESPVDEVWPNDTGVKFTATNVFVEAKPYGKEQVRHAYVLSGDTLALVVHSRKGKAGAERIPFHQTLILQNQLLG